MTEQIEPESPQSDICFASSKGTPINEPLLCRRWRGHEGDHKTRDYSWPARNPTADSALAARRGYVLTGTVDIIRGLTGEYQAVIKALLEAVPGKKDEIVTHAREVMEGAHKALQEIIEAS